MGNWGLLITGDEIHVAGDDALVVASVVMFSSLGGKAGAMAAVVEEEDVPRPGGSDETGEGVSDVGTSGLGGGFIGVDEDSDVVFGETVAVDEALMHPLHVVDASFQLCLRSRVVASHQKCFPRHRSRSLCVFLTAGQKW